MTSPLFTAETTRRRLARVQQEMQRQGIETLILGPGADLRYLTGFNAFASERMNLLVVHQSGSPDYIVPLFEAPLLGADAGTLANLHPWRDGEDPAALAAGLIGGGNGPIAVGATLPSGFLLRLQHKIHATWQEAGPLMRELRMIKDDAEIAAMQHVASLTDDSWAEFIETVPIVGMTERQALDALLELIRKRGLTDLWGICGSGPNGASPHHDVSDRILQTGDAVVFDWGGTFNGYNSDITRTIHIGQPGDEFLRCYDAVLRANQAALDAMVPGTPLEEIDLAARRVIEDAGYGEAFIHRLGHGLGLELHEEPYVVRGNTLPLAPGMVFSDEPGIYLEGKFGIRIEDAVVATAQGGRRLNEAKRTLQVIE